MSRSVGVSHDVYNFFAHFWVVDMLGKLAAIRRLKKRDFRVFMDGLHENDQGIWYLRRAKLAVAVAIIKSKPKGTSGREHAEYLASRLRYEDNDWKAKAQALQEEVLQLRQELLLSSLQSKLTGSTATGDTGISQVAEGSLRSSMPWEHDSGFGTGSSMEMQPLSPAPEVPRTRSFSLPPVCSFSASPLEQSSGGSASTRERAVLHHTQFLQSLVGLGWPANSRDSSVVSESLCQLLSCMVEAWAEPRLLPPASLLLRAARVAAQAVDPPCGHVSRKLVGQAEECLKELTALLLGNTRLNWFQRQETLADCLAVLGGSPSLKPTFVLHALCEVNAFGDHLRQSLSEGLGQFDVARYENCFYLLRVLEQLLQNQGEDEGRVRNPSLSSSLSRLEVHVLQLSDDFPLLAIFMWRIGACLKATET